MTGWLIASSLLGFGGLVIAAVAASDAAASKDEWRQLVWFVAIVAALINVGVSLFFMGKQGYVVLIRDTVASAAIAVALTHLTARVAILLRERGCGPALRVIACTIVALLLSVTAPFVVLLVHCTSGDCL